MAKLIILSNGVEVLPGRSIISFFKKKKIIITLQFFCMQNLCKVYSTHSITCEERGKLGGRIK